MPAPFAHQAEADFAELLNFYRIPWLYEPTSFAIEWDGDAVTEMFTPDFYLPDQDLYIELTTMKQSLVTKKNRKVRLLRELYPGSAHQTALPPRLPAIASRSTATARSN